MQHCLSYCKLATISDNELHSTIFDGSGDMKLLVLIDYSASFNIMSSLVAKHLDWVIRPNTTAFEVKLANGKIVYSKGIANGLVLSGV